MARDEAHVKKLFNRLYKGIQERIPHVYLNGDLEARFHGNLNLSFAFVEGESLLMALKNVACSSGSACTSESLEPSYVLRALGVDEDLAHTSIRFGIGMSEHCNRTDSQVVFLQRLKWTTQLN
jgi:cysteine desulfurase